MFTRKLILHGKSKRLWQAEVSGSTLRIDTGTPKKLTRAEKEHSNFDLAIDALRKAQLAKLRAGYVLDGVHGALVGLLGVETSSVVALSPDGELVWSVAHDDMSHGTLRVREAATGALVSEHVLPGAFGRVLDLHVRSRTEAVLATGSDGVTRFDLARTGPSFADVGGHASDVFGAGNRVVAITQRDGAVLFDADEGRVLLRVPNATAAALSPDGAMMVACDRDSSELAVYSAVDGRPHSRISLGHGKGARALAITQEHLVAAGIWFPGARRHTTWAWTVSDGQRTLLERFSDADDSDQGSAVFGAGGRLLALTHVYGLLQIFDAHDGAGRLCSCELGRTAKGTTLRGSPDGRWLLGYDGSGLAAVWDFARVLAGEGENEFELSIESDETRERPAPTTARLPAAEQTATLTLPLGTCPSFQGQFPGGVIYVSTSSEVTTLVELATWPPRTTRRAQVVLACARNPKGVWFVRDRDGLWITADFSAQGERVEAPFEPAQVGWLGEAPVIFDEDGEVSPQFFTGEAWTPITGLVKADARGDTGSHHLADGTPIVTYRGTAYRVDEVHRAHRLFDVRGVYARNAVVLADGRIASNSGVSVELAGPGRTQTSLPLGSKRHGAWYVLPGPGGTLLVTFSGRGGPNHTDLAGSLLDLKGKATPLPKPLFGVEPKVILSELLACEDRILARVDFGGTFRAIPSPRPS